MSDKKFDNEIKEIFDQFEESYDPTSWDSLSSKMDTVEFDSDTSGEEDYIPHVKEKLQNHREPLNEEHWEVFRDGLDEISNRRKHIFITKAVELALVLLLILTYFNYKTLTNFPKVEIDENYLYASTDESTVQDIIAVAHVESTNRLPSPIVTNQVVSMAPSQQILDYTSVVVDNAISDKKAEQFSDTVVEYAQNSKELEIANVDATSDAAIGNITIQSLNVPGPRLPVLTTPEIVVEKKTTKKGWTMSIPFSYDLNLINSSFDFSYLTSPLNSGLSGSSIGILVGKEFKSLEIETGLMYSEKTYAPGQLLTYSKSGSTSFLESEIDAADFQQISIPITAKLHAPSKGVVAAYAVAGIGFNAILRSEYEVSKTITPTARITQATVPQQSLDLSTLPKGFAEGGGLEKNFFMTAIVGIGLKANLVNDMSLFFQPQYQLNFSNNSNELFHKVHSLNFQSGLKFRF